MPRPCQLQTLPLRIGPLPIAEVRECRNGMSRFRQQPAFNCAKIEARQMV